MSNIPTEIWSVKYALTEGVKLYPVDKVSEAGYISVKGTWMSLKLGRDCAVTREEAECLAEAMRMKKIASLRKQIAKLEKMQFGVLV